MTDPTPVLTLWQPWATLIALGAKRIETRSWSTKYRGPLAIHAADRRPPMMHLPRLWSRGATRDEQDRWNRETWLVIDTITDPAHQRPHRTNPPERIPKASKTPTLFFPHAGPHADVDEETGYARTLYLPLGVIVAVCDLVDVVPIDHELTSGTGITWDTDRSRLLSRERTATSMCWRDVTDQHPLGDFTQGRFAWLLDGIRPLDEPVPFKGGQGLSRRWTPEATMAR